METKLFSTANQSGSTYPLKLEEETQRKHFLVKAAFYNQGNYKEKTRKTRKIEKMKATVVFSKMNEILR